MSKNHKALTQSQLSLWTGQKLNSEVPLYNMAHSFDIEGELDVASFQKAFKGVLKRTDALRTVFTEIESIPYQHSIPELDFSLELIDFSSKEDIAIQSWMKQRSQLIFDLTKSVFDSVLIKVNEKRHIWFLNIHHLVTDATSSTILYNLQAKLYRQIQTDNSDDSFEIPSYSDYLLFEIKQKDTELSPKIKEFWKTKIESLKAPPELYGRKHTSATSVAKRISLKLGTERSQKLRELAQKNEIRAWTQDLTLFNLFTTTLFTFIHRISGQERLAIGAPSHNRPTKKFKQTPGLFIEVFPLVTEFEESDTFFSVFEKIKHETSDYMRYAQPGMSTSESSRSFNVVLNYINAAFPSFNGMPMSSEWIHPEHTDPGHQLRCHIYDMDASGDIEVLFDLNTEVFHESLQNEVTNHFLSILDALISDINQSVYKPSLVTETITKTGVPQKDFDSILNQFEAQVLKTPNKTALRFKKGAYTYQQLNEKVNQYANYFSKQGISSNDSIAIYLERSPEYIFAVLATLKLNASFIPIASDQPKERIEFIVQDGNSKFLIAHSDFGKAVDNIEASVLFIDQIQEDILSMNSTFQGNNTSKDDVAYTLFTSGSTGKPKGVLISQGALANYTLWAKEYYKTDTPFVFPLFTSIGFDLTITSTFLPLITGGELIIYKESNSGPDISLMEVLAQNKVNTIKLTPSHLALIKGADMRHSAIKTMIVGGEDFKTNLAQSIQESFAPSLRMFNEYGPTEATVGCIVAEYDVEKHNMPSVPIGLPINGMEALVLDTHKNKVPQGVIGELFMTGIGLANGYSNSPKLTAEKFIKNPFEINSKMYATGDAVRYNLDGNIEFLGRKDEQIKLRGFRLELSDIEANLLKHEAVENTAVVLIENEKSIPENEVINCSECGLPSNYPNTDFDEDGVCHVCNAFKGYKDQAQKYFKTEEELRKILISQRGKSPNYDCISLLSGGKDSTYILAQLINMGLRVLAFTLDNGYISEQAKENVNRIVTKLNVDHIYGTTEHMNAIFVDSLHRHQNVCNGCFKAIYTLSTQIAIDKQIPFVVTGLSRGQFFETRLTEELFWDENADVTTIDDTILEARKLYHQEEDAVKELMDVSIFNNNDTFEKVQFIDFYRYSDVSLEEMLVFLKEKVDWVRPTDTGRSTNCLINQLGIYVHKKEKGFSNYSFPYSWDVRMGHKTRTETLEEINEIIDEKEVKRIALEIGYQESDESELEQQRLVGYYTGKEKISSKELANHLKQKLPEYMVPSYFKYIEELPLTKNGKVDKVALKNLNTSQLEMETPYVAPQGEIEELLANIWKEVLRLKQVGSQDDFIALGGHSLAAIRVTARINEEIEMKFPLNKIFELPTIADYANYVEQTLIELLDD